MLICKLYHLYYSGYYPQKYRHFKKVDIVFVNNNEKRFLYASLVIVLLFDNGAVDKKYSDDGDDDVYLIYYSMLDIMQDMIKTKVIKCKNNTSKIFKTSIMDNIINGMKDLPKENIMWGHTKERGYKFGLVPK